MFLIEKNHSLVYIYKKKKQKKNQMSLEKDLVIKHMHPDKLYKLNIDKQ